MKVISMSCLLRTCDEQVVKTSHDGTVILSEIVIQSFFLSVFCKLQAGRHERIIVFSYRPIPYTCAYHFVCQLCHTLDHTLIPLAKMVGRYVVGRDHSTGNPYLSRFFLHHWPQSSLDCLSGIIIMNMKTN